MKLVETANKMKDIGTLCLHPAPAHPYGMPRVLLGLTAVLVSVRTVPPSVTRSVATVGDKETSGIEGADASFKPPGTSRGEYVLVASSDDTVSPTCQGTEVLNEYGGVVYEGAGRR